MFSGAATAVLELHGGASTASVPRLQLPSPLKALTESDIEVLPWAPDRGMWCEDKIAHWTLPSMGASWGLLGWEEASGLGPMRPMRPRCEGFDIRFWVVTLPGPTTN